MSPSPIFFPDRSGNARIVPGVCKKPWTQPNSSRGIELGREISPFRFWISGFRGRFTPKPGNYLTFADCGRISPYKNDSPLSPWPTKRHPGPWVFAISPSGCKSTPPECLFSDFDRLFWIFSAARAALRAEFGHGPKVSSVIPRRGPHAMHAPNLGSISGREVGLGESWRLCFGRKGFNAPIRPYYYIYI
jgi:hypothetical protein